MKPTRILMAALLAAPAAYAAEMTIYLQPDFQGKQVTLDGNTRNLADIGFHDQASSLMIRSGRWEICTQPEFRGECRIIGPGEYRTLDQKFNHRIESARLVGGGEQRVARYSDRDGRRYGEGDRYVPEGAAEPTIRLFSRPGFRGKSTNMDFDAPILAVRDFDDSAASVIITGGRWQLCTEPEYRGMCTTLGPGQYSDLGFGMARTISSLRRVG